MKIKAVNYWKEDLELTRPYTIAFKTVSAVENCFVEVVLENGITGIGSANPSKQVTGEAIEETYESLSKIDWLIGQDIRSLNVLLNELNRRCPTTPAALAAIDIALHDAFTQHLDLPLVTYLGQKIKSLPTSITIGIKDVQESLKEAKEYTDRGFTHLKVKLGKTVDEDLEVLIKLREEYGDKIKIRIDANQGYDVPALLRFCEKSVGLNLELIEQPLPANAIQAMKNLPEAIKSKIAADESLLSPEDAIKLTSGSQSCGIFNIKLMKCGGISKAKDIATIAEYTGTDLMWGCNDESIVSITAALHAAFASTQTKYIDLDGSLDLARDVVAGGFEINNGMMSIVGKAGLGLIRNVK